MRLDGGGEVTQLSLGGDEGVTLSTSECDAGMESVEGSSKLGVSRADEGSKVAEVEGDSSKLVLLVGGEFSKSRRSSRPRLVAMSKN